MCERCIDAAKGLLNIGTVSELERVLSAKGDEHRMVIQAELALSRLADRYLSSAEMTDEMVARANEISDRVWKTELQGLGSMAEMFLVGDRIVRSVLQGVDEHYRTYGVPAEEQSEHQQAAQDSVPMPASAHSQGLMPVVPMSGRKRGH